MLEKYPEYLPLMSLQPFKINVFTNAPEPSINSNEIEAGSGSLRAYLTLVPTVAEFHTITIVLRIMC